MVERAPETGVDPLMKFSSQKNTFPPGAQSSTWRHKQSPKEFGVLPENLPQLQKNRMFAAVFGMVNDFPCQHEFSFAKQIQTSILDETIFGNGRVGLAIFCLKYWNSSPVMELYKRLLGHCSLIFYVFK